MNGFSENETTNRKRRLGCGVQPIGKVLAELFVQQQTRLAFVRVARLRTPFATAQEEQARRTGASTQGL